MMSTSASKTNLLHRLIQAAIGGYKRRLTLSSAKQELFKVQDDKDFEEKVEKSKGPVIVDFYATWCAPCKALEPRLEDIVAKHPGKVTVAKVDVDCMSEIAIKYKVKSVPALVFIRNGKKEDSLVGLQDADTLDIWVKNMIKEK